MYTANADNAFQMAALVIWALHIQGSLMMGCEVLPMGVKGVLRLLCAKRLPNSKLHIDEAFVCKAVAEFEATHTCKSKDFHSKPFSFNTRSDCLIIHNFVVSGRGGKCRC